MMIDKLFILTLFLLLISCKAQIILLDNLSVCENGINCPDYTSVKDSNNSLNKFAGFWKGRYTDGRTYEFQFIKKLDFSLYGGKLWDRLIGKILVKNSNGIVLQNTLTKIDTDTHFYGYYFDKMLTKYQMYYSGNAECNDKGYVYLSFPDSNNLNQMKLVFTQDRDIIASCPNGYKTVIPDGKAIILTKK